MLTALYFFVTAGITFLVRQYDHYLINFFYSRIIWQTPISRVLFYRYADCLQDFMPYFKNLSPNGKALSINKVYGIGEVILSFFKA